MGRWAVALLAGALVALSAFIAGCQEEREDSAEGSAPAQPSAPPELVLGDCRHLLAFAEVEHGTVADDLPSGFAPAGGQTEATARLVVLATSCQKLGGVPHPVRELLVAVEVDPPRQLAGADAWFHLYALQWTTTSGPAFLQYGAMGVPVEPAAMDYEEEIAGPLLSGEAGLRDGSVRLDVAAPERASPDVAGELRVFAGSRGAAAVDVAWPDFVVRVGAAVVEAPSDWVGATGRVAGLGFQEEGPGYGLTIRPAQQ